jgi:hypothetical protein
METSILQPDDFKVGMFITVKDLKQTAPEFDMENVENPIQIMAMMQGGGPPSRNTRLEALKGSVIRIDAINFPFMIVTIFENAPRPGKIPDSQSLVLDVREVEFMKLNEEYVNAYLGKTSLMTLLEDKKFKDIQNIEGYETLSVLLDACLQKIKKEEEKKDENT